MYSENEVSREYTWHHMRCNLNCTSKPFILIQNLSFDSVLNCESLSLCLFIDDYSAYVASVLLEKHVYKTNGCSFFLNTLYVVPNIIFPLLNYSCRPLRRRSSTWTSSWAPVLMVKVGPKLQSIRLTPFVFGASIQTAPLTHFCRF